MVITTCLTVKVLINHDVSLYLCVSKEKAFYSTCDINQRYIVMQKCKNLNRPLFFRFFRKRLFKRLFFSSVHVFFPSPPLSDSKKYCSLVIHICQSKFLLSKLDTTPTSVFFALKTYQHTYSRLFLFLCPLFCTPPTAAICNTFCCS